MKFRPLTVIAALLVSGLALTKTATATSVEFGNIGGTLSGSNAGLGLSGSKLVAVKGLSGGIITGADLGSLSFTTGALTSGSLTMGGMLAGGGTFSVTGNGTDGIPSGTLFTGTFSGPVGWTLETLPDGTHNYVLSGVVTGKLLGSSANGFSLQLTVSTGTALFSGSVEIASGNTVIKSFPVHVPEPSVLLLLATGAVGMLGMIGRKPLVL